MCKLILKLLSCIFHWVSFSMFLLLQVSPLNEVEKILDCEMRPPTSDEPDTSKTSSKPKYVKLYLVKWKGLSYLHCTW